MLRLRADCESCLFAAKLPVIICRINCSIRSSAVLDVSGDRPAVVPSARQPLYLQTYFRLAASGLRGKAAADNQSLRLHRPQPPVSPTAAS